MRPDIGTQSRKKVILAERGMGEARAFSRTARYVALNPQFQLRYNSEEYIGAVGVSIQVSRGRKRFQRA
jgi:hypothetical protein